MIKSTCKNTGIVFVEINGNSYRNETLFKPIKLSRINLQKATFFNSSTIVKNKNINTILMILKESFYIYVISMLKCNNVNYNFKVFLKKLFYVLKIP